MRGRCAVCNKKLIKVARMVADRWPCLTRVDVDGGVRESVVGNCSVTTLIKWFIFS